MYWWEDERLGHESALRIPLTLSDLGTHLKPDCPDLQARHADLSAIEIDSILGPGVWLLWSIWRLLRYR